MKGAPSLHATAKTTWLAAFESSLPPEQQPCPTWPKATSSEKTNPGDFRPGLRNEPSKQQSGLSSSLVEAVVHRAMHGPTSRSGPTQARSKSARCIIEAPAERPTPMVRLVLTPASSMNIASTHVEVAANRDILWRSARLQCHAARTFRRPVRARASRSAARAKAKARKAKAKDPNGELKFTQPHRNYLISTRSLQA